MYPNTKNIFHSSVNPNFKLINAYKDPTILVGDIKPNMIVM